MSINRDCLGKTYGPVEREVDAGAIAAYAAATGARGADGTAPPVFGIVPVWPAIQAALADEELDLDVGRIVHGEQRMTFHRPIRAGDRLVSSGRVASIEDRGANEVMVLSFETHDANGELVTAQDVVCVSRGTGANRGDAPKPPRRVEEAPREPDAVRRTTLAPDITFRYAQASGDDNRIHVDEAFAKSVGLPGIIVQGMCLFAIALQAVVDEAPAGDAAAVRAAAVRFRSPIRPGETLETAVTRADGEMRFESRDGAGTIVLSGTATLD
ncbi:MAG TPA: MaoC/PaaZ C-terminal domain-containing protein [Gaiellaceae bacterium]|nr:MaoC/PaaZ C-terminal domain-containing protein [Gaiellaceae bacterium]